LLESDVRTGRLFRESAITASSDSRGPELTCGTIVCDAIDSRRVRWDHSRMLRFLAVAHPVGLPVAAATQDILPILVLLFECVSH
jgi:hypothetical protein